MPSFICKMPRANGSTMIIGLPGKIAEQTSEKCGHSVDLFSDSTPVAARIQPLWSSFVLLFMLMA
jgi:hypothetical protein